MDFLDTETIAIEKTLMHMSWAAQKRLAQELAEFHLTVPQYVTLRAIQHEENGCTMTRLAQASYQVAATMTGIIDRLVEQGLVERIRDPQDRRAQRVILRPPAQDLLSQVEARSQARIQHYLKTFTHAERQQFLNWIQQYLDLVMDGE